MVCKKGINNMPRGWRMDNKWNYKAYESRGEYKTAGGYIWKYFDESGDMNEQKES